LTQDFYEFLSLEEKRRSLRRLRTECLDQLWLISAPRFQRAKRLEDRTLPSLADELWGAEDSPKPSPARRERIHALALERAIETERRRGTPEGVLAEVTEAFELWCAKADQMSGGR